MKKWIATSVFALSMSFAAFAVTGPTPLSDAELAATEGGQIAICCAECHGHPDGTIHCTGCRFCEVQQEL